jgi:UDP-N-acetyl-D-mannosaminuronate dehydrogenase
MIDLLAFAVGALAFVVGFLVARNIYTTRYSNELKVILLNYKTDMDDTRELTHRITGIMTEIMREGNMIEPTEPQNKVDLSAYN